MISDTFNPDYYKANKHQNIQIIEMIRDMPFSLGNAVKYIYRCRQKENRANDLSKALWYIQDHKNNRSQLAIDRNDEYFSISQESIEVLLSESDDFEKETITKIYDIWLKNGDYQTIEKNLSEEIKKSKIES